MRASSSLVAALRPIRPSQRVIRNVRLASTSMRMPAMSPTMTEGGIAGWKKQEGESFTTGDVLLEIETDKATIDVEAQEDGIMGKILVEAGSSKIPVGQVIAVLAEEGDDLSSLEIPKDLSPPDQASPAASSSTSSEPEKPKEEPKKEAKEESQPKKQEASGSSGGQAGAAKQEEAGHGHKEIKHPKPLFPSVSRLLQESSLSSAQISKLKGTGKDGMLTKGDVLLAMGKIKNAFGSADKLNLDVMGPSGKRKSEAQASQGGTAAPTKKEEPLDGPALRRLILAGMSKATEPAKPIVSHEPNPLPLSSDAEFDSVIAPYSSLLSRQPNVAIPSAGELAESQGSAGVKKDEWAGLW